MRARTHPEITPSTDREARPIEGPGRCTPGDIRTKTLKERSKMEPNNSDLRTISKREKGETI
jgi:hypothetical protein